MFVPSFLFHHGSHSEARELKSCIPMEVFLSRGDDDLDSFLDLATAVVWALLTTVIPSPPF